MNLARAFAVLTVLLMNCLFAPAQQSSAAAAQSSLVPKILKIDPPNWWAQMPKPMLLIRGENLFSAQVRLSDSHLKIVSKKISDNGHWLELWLSESPAKVEAITITVKTTSGTTSAPYKFEARRASSDGFAGFSSADVMYLIMTDRFADGDLTNDGTPTAHSAELAKIRGWHGGDLRGISNHIDYLQDLGVNTVWITPVCQNHGDESYHGYGATDMYSVDEHYGSLQDYIDLANRLHASHMKLVLDTVPNHIGPNHLWVTDPPEPTWFHGTLAHHTEAQGDFKPLTDSHAPWRDQRNVTQGWFANTLPDLNQENPAVAQYLIQNAVWWIETAGLDGLRLDTFPYVGRSFWHDFHAELHGLYPKLTTVGEVFNPDATITSSFAGGVTRNGTVDTGLDTPFDFPTYFALRETLLKDAPMTKLADSLRLDALYPHPERLVPFMGNHDTARFLNGPEASPQKLQLAFTILTTMRGMPQIYSGDEIAMRGGEDPDNRQDFPGGFVDQHGPIAFSAGTRTPEQRATFDAVKKLLALRRSFTALQTGEEQVIHADADTLVYVRSLKRLSGSLERVVVAVNKGKEAKIILIDVLGTLLEDAAATSTLIGEQDTMMFASGKLVIHVGAESAYIAEVK